MEHVHTGSRGWRNILAHVAASPLHRGATLAMLLSGLGTAAAAPQIVLYLVRDLGAPLPIASLFYLTSLTAPFAGYLVGRRSDQTGRRLGLFRLCAVSGGLGWVCIATSTTVWMPFAASTLLLASSGAATSQIFAALHDDLARHPHPAGDSIIAIVRMALTAGWVIGPALGAWFSAEAGLRPLFWLTAACFLAQILPLGRLTLPAAPTQPKTTASRAPGLRQMRPLLAFTALFVLVYCGEPIKYGYLLLYMEDHLRLAPALRGGIIGLQPLIELLVMPFSVLLGRRFGVLWLLCAAAACAVAANLCFALWASALGMIAGQTLMGLVWGIFFVLGIIVAQDLLPGAVATASAIFMNAGTLGLAGGGLAGGASIGSLGLPHVFFIPAGCALLATIGLAAMAARQAGRRPFTT